MDERTFIALELDSLVGLLARHVQTPLGRKRALELRPSMDRMEIELGLDLTTETVEYLKTGERFGLSGIEDPQGALAQLQIEATSLDPHQILAMERLIAVGVDLSRQFKETGTRERYPELSRLTARIPDMRRLLEGMRGKILPGGEIDDNASPELRAIRREFAGRRARIYRTLEAILHEQTRAVQEELVTFRNGRFVIPIRTDSRGLVPGVVHGLSSSGQTTFVEPLVVIDQNNELVRLREQEEIEIARILFEITESLRANLPGIRFTAQTIAEIDLAQAKATLSFEFNCARPLISGERSLLLRDARHILLEHSLKQSGGRVVPISLELDKGRQVLVISGPNAGGKTVVLKTVGLVSLMAQMGLHVPTSEAVLPVFDQVFADIGDQQSISANLSTFTAHMRNISEMAQKLDPPALVLLDEVGTGTDPDEGAALAVAIVDYFRRAGATTIATTHYPGLKMWATQAEGILSASVEFDEHTLQPTYRLILGIAGASSGIEIARRMDVPAEILDAAKTRINPDHAQASRYLKTLKAVVDEQIALRKALAEERQAVASEHAKLDQQSAKREAERRAKFDETLARVVRDYTAESQRLIESLKDRAEAARLKKAAANRAAELHRLGDQMRKEAERQSVLSGSPAEKGQLAVQQPSTGAEPSAQVTEIHEGDFVKISSLEQIGTVESIRAGIYTIRAGALRFRATRNEIQPTEPTKPAMLPRPQTSGVVLDVDLEFVPELNVIGMTADDATDRVDKFLDDAFLAGVDSVRIIHGHGRGILRRAVAQLLTNHPQVERFALAPPDKGGSGATVVELRK